MYKFRKNFIEIFNKNFHRDKLNFVKISTSIVTRGMCCGRSGEQMESKLDQALHMLNTLVHRPRAVSLTVPVRSPADTDDL